RLRDGDDRLTEGDAEGAAGDPVDSTCDRKHESEETDLAVDHGRREITHREEPGVGIPPESAHGIEVARVDDPEARRLQEPPHPAARVSPAMIGQPVHGSIECLVGRHHEDESPPAAREDASEAYERPTVIRDVLEDIEADDGVDATAGHGLGEG